MSRIRTVVTVLAVLALTLAGCGSGDVTAEPAPATGGPRDGDWTLVDGTGPDGPLTLVPGSDVTLTVTGAAVSGRSACNSYGGSARVTDTGFVPGALAVTEMACTDPAVMTLESAYLTALAKVRTATVDGDRLVLRGDGVALTFARPAPVAAAAFEGTRWTLDSLVSGESVSSVVGEPWLRFDGGRVTGDAACATVTGAYRVDGTTLTLTDLEVVSPATVRCTADAVTQAEFVRSVLSAPMTIAVDGGRLTLTSGAVGLGLVAP